MDCSVNTRLLAVRAAALTLTIVLVGQVQTPIASAQRAGAARLVYNPVTGRTQPNTRFNVRNNTARQTPQQPQDFADEAVYENDPAYVESPTFAGDSAEQLGHIDPAQYCETCDCGDAACCGGVGCPVAGDCGTGCCDTVGCCTGVGCGDGCGVGCAPCCGWYSGFEATFLKPRFENNTALTIMDSTDGVTNASFTDSPFNHDLEFSPRVFLGWQQDCGVGLRATWWHFDHDADPARANPPASGFGRISPPDFDGVDVDISTNVPTDNFLATTDLSAYAIDLETTKQAGFCGWQVGMGCGFRYAYVEQGYQAATSNAAGDPIGNINFRHTLEGFGPTVSMDVFRPYNSCSGVFCKARGSLLFGDAESQFRAAENINATQTDTTRSTASDDLLTIGELQVGYRWLGLQNNCRPYRPFCSIAMEGQVWDGAGSAASQDGALGFFGFNTAVGVNW